MRALRTTTALTTLCAITCLLNAACSALASSDQFAPLGQDRAALCAALCKGLSTCSNTNIDPTTCANTCTEGGPNGAQFDCYIDVVLADTDDSTDPDDVTDSATQLCQLLRFNAADAATCVDASDVCDVECNLLQSTCQDLVLYATCLDNCLGLYDLTADEFKDEFKCMKDNRILANKAETAATRAAQCVAASAPCEAGKACAPTGAAPLQIYQCVPTCQNAQSECPSGSQCVQGYCVP
jgi:hypothetical protein